MPWGKPKKGGWEVLPADEPVSRFTQIIRTVLEVMPGGVIRHGKTGPDDDAHVGFWLGVTADGTARFSVGGPAFFVKWTGTTLLVRGNLSTPGSDLETDWVRWIGADAQPIAYLHGSDVWGHMLEIATPIPDAAGDPGMLDLFVDGDFAASLRLRLITKRGQGKAGTRLALLIGNVERFFVDGQGNAGLAGRMAAATAVAAGEVVNLGQADARYLARSAGVSGTFAVEAGKSLTFSNGQLTAVEGF